MKRKSVRVSELVGWVERSETQQVSELQGERVKEYRGCEIYFARRFNEPSAFSRQLSDLKQVSGLQE
ncbi:hypothetical protein A3733_23525 [Pseudoalteromonas shioyasakiensis]|nr:hypothetical protein A3733_23525 [Pseudoalteromonas shioyasakiensis]